MHNFLRFLCKATAAKRESGTQVRLVTRLAIEHVTRSLQRYFPVVINHFHPGSPREVISCDLPEISRLRHLNCLFVKLSRLAQLSVTGGNLRSRHNNLKLTWLIAGPFYVSRPCFVVAG